MATEVRTWHPSLLSRSVFSVFAFFFFFCLICVLVIKKMYLINEVRKRDCRAQK